MSYTLILRKFYKIIMDELIYHVELPHECNDIIREAHDELLGGHFNGELTIKKVLQVKLWFPSLHHDGHFYFKSYDICQRIDWPSKWDELPLQPILSLLQL